jgi:hypothetical protein
LAEATAAAEATREILSKRYKDAPWVFQVVDAVKNAVQNGIELLSNTSISGNSQSGDSYRFEARTRDELMATQHLVPKNTVKIDESKIEEEKHAEQPDRRDNNSSMSWML